MGTSRNAFAVPRSAGGTGQVEGSAGRWHGARMGDEQLTIVLAVDTLAGIGLAAAIGLALVALASGLVARIGAARVNRFAAWLALASGVVLIVTTAIIHTAQ